jgi:heme-degrading monooxygenase HmoA
MYGTVARMRLKAGAEVEMNRLSQEWSQDIPGFVFQHVYKLDSGPNEFILVVAFDSKASYEANAKSQEQAARYQQYSALMDGAPEWNDGEIVFTQQA